MDYTKKYITLLEKTTRDQEETIEALRIELSRWMMLGNFEEVAFNYACAARLMPKLAEHPEFMPILADTMEEMFTSSKESQNELWLKKIMGELNIDGDTMPEEDDGSGG